MLQSAFMKAQYYTTYFDGFLSKQKNALIQRRLQYCTTLGKLEDRDQYCEPQTLQERSDFFFLPDTSTKHIFVLIYLFMQILLFLILKNQRLYRHSFHKISAQEKRRVIDIFLFYRQKVHITE